MIAVSDAQDEVCDNAKNEGVSDKITDSAAASDFAGVVWTSMDENGAWRTELAKELKAAGYQIDWNRVMA